MTTNKERPPIAEAPLSEARPSDLELMMYFDDELEEPRKSAVSAFIAADHGAQNKLAALRITSGVVRRYASNIEPSLNIADLVMKAVEAETSTKAAIFPSAAQRSNVIPISAAKNASSASKAAAARRPANDNVRRIFGVAALAVAAAAALAIWGRQTAGPGNHSSGLQVAVTIPVTPLQPGIAPTADDKVIDSAAQEADAEHGVEVAAVNFGAHMGSIFYVPSGSIEANHTTTVVWLADDAGE